MMPCPIPLFLLSVAAGYLIPSFYCGVILCAVWYITYIYMTLLQLPYATSETLVDILARQRKRTSNNIVGYSIPQFTLRQYSDIIWPVKSALSNTVQQCRMNSL